MSAFIDSYVARQKLQMTVLHTSVKQPHKRDHFVCGTGIALSAAKSVERLTRLQTANPLQGHVEAPKIDLCATHDELVPVVVIHRLHSQPPSAPEKEPPPLKPTLFVFCGSVFIAMTGSCYAA